MPAVNPERIRIAAAADPEFTMLKQVLEQHGFAVKIAVPPRRWAYGLLQAKSKTIWINPAVFELEIAVPTIVHEAVHAAQRCVSGPELRPLGLGIAPPQITWRHVTRYHSYRRAVEAEAYAVQTRPDRVTLAMSIVRKYC